MTALGSLSVAVRSAKARASVPARVRRATWYGAVVCSIASANWEAKVFATTRRIVAPVTMPRSFPVGLRSAVRRPCASAGDGAWDLGSCEGLRHVAEELQELRVLQEHL